MKINVIALNVPFKDKYILLLRQIFSIYLTHPSHANINTAVNGSSYELWCLFLEINVPKNLIESRHQKSVFCTECAQICSSKAPRRSLIYSLGNTDVNSMAVLQR